MSRSSTPSIPLPNLSSVRLQSSSPRPTPQHVPLASSSKTSTYALLSVSDTAHRLGTSLVRGLSQREAGIRLITHGPNELPHEEPEPLWLRFVKQFKETLILLLLASAAVSAFIGNWDDALSITLAVTIVISVAFVQEYRSEKSLEALNRLVPHHAHLIRDGGKDSSSSDSPSDSGVSIHMSEPTTSMDSTSKESGPIEKASTTVLASQLVPGDLVLFATGDRIPADIRITRATDLSIDESNLTGENEPVRKDTESLKTLPADFSFGSEPVQTNPPSYSSPATGTVGADIRLNEQTNIAFMGTLVRSGHGQGIVVATGPHTEFGAISASLTEIESPRTPLQLSMDRLGQELSYISFAVIFLIVLVGLWQGRKLLAMFTIGVSLAVAAIPEGLPIIVTVTLALGVLRMARQGAIVRRLPSVETLGSVNVVCTDKTGTLTTNHMTVTKLWHFDLASPIEVNKEFLSSTLEPVTQKIIRIGNVANNARLSNKAANSSASVSVLSSTMGNDPAHPRWKGRWVGQPTDVAMLDLIDFLGQDDIRESVGTRVSETPFSSERKWMGVVTSNAAGSDSESNGRSGASESVYLKGAVEQVLSRCDTYLTKEGQEVVLDEPRRNAALSAADQMASEGLRVLGFASGPQRSSSSLGNSGQRRGKLATPMRSRSPLSSSASSVDDGYQGLVFAGLVGINDPPRKGVEKSIRRLMSGGVKVIMITGDSEATALAIAKRVGMAIGTTRVSTSGSLSKGTVLTGNELDRMTEGELAQAITRTSIFARTSPDHKLKIVRALQSRGDVVAMTGDGVNDAPALKKADIGVSMGLLGTDVAKEAADMILTDDDFSTILSAIEEGKGIFYNIQNFLTFQLSTSVAALSLVFLSTVLGLKNPLNAMQILWINILMDGPPAQSLGVEPVDPAVMTRPPRSRTARVLTRPLIRRVLTSATIIVLGTMLTYIHEMTVDGLVTARDTTMTFTCFVFFDMFNALTCRSEGKSVLLGEVGLLSNRMFDYAVAGSVAGQMAVIYLPFFQRIFQTEALRLVDLLALTLLASSVFWVDEARKWVLARRRRRGLTGYSRSV